MFCRVLVVSMVMLGFGCHGPGSGAPASPQVLPEDVRLVPQIGHAAHAIAISPDGTMIASIGDGAVKVWSIASGLLVQSFPTIEDQAIAFSRDGKTLLSTGVKLATWTLVPLADRAVEQPGPTLAQDAQATFRTAAWSADGKRRALGMAGKTQDDSGIRVIDERDQVLWTGHVHGDVLSVAYTADGKTLVSLGSDGVTRAWNAETGKAQWQSESAGALVYGSAAIAISPNGKLVATCEHKTGIAVREIATGTLARRLAGTCSGVTFLDDHSVVGFGDMAGAWNIADGQLAWTFPSGSDLRFGSASPDGRLIVAGGDRGLQIWTSQGRLLRTLRGRRVPQMAACLSPDGATVVGIRPNAAQYARGDVSVWSLREARQVAHWPVDAPIYTSTDTHWETCTITPDNRAVLIPTVHGLRVVDLATGVSRAVPTSALIYKVTFFPDRSELLAAAQHDLFRIRLSDGKELARYTGAHFIDAIGVSGDGAIVAATTVKGELVRWDAATAKQVGTEAAGEAAALRSRDETLAFDGGLVRHDSNPLYFHENRILSADGRSIVQLDQQGRVQRIDARTETATRGMNIVHGGQQQLAGLTSDGRFALVIDAETLQIADLDSGHSYKLASDGDDWLLYTEDGYFDSSRNAGALLAAARGLEVYRIDQLAVRNNRPDLILERLRLANPDAIAYYHARYLRRLKALDLDERALAIDIAPTAEIDAVAVDGDHANVTINLRSSRGDLLAYEVYVNGAAMHGGGGTRISGNHLSTTIPVPLGVGDNRIEIGALGASGVEGLRPTRVVRREGTARRRLYFVGFGVSKYQRAAYNLTYPSKDVADLAAVLSQATGYDDKVIKPYTDEQVTVSAITEAKRELLSSGVDDTVIVFFAGHGMHARDENAEYYFATHEADRDDLAHTAASFELIDSLLDGIPARHKLLLLDTCESGDLLAEPDRKVIARQHNLVSRGLVVDETAEATPRKRASTKPREFLLARDRFILTDLTRRTGAVVLASSRGEELSYEADEVKNGLFTEALLLALTGAGADLDHDNVLSIEELRTFVTQYVAASTNELQHPTIDSDNPYADIVVPVVPTARPIVDR